MNWQIVSIKAPGYAIDFLPAIVVDITNAGAEIVEPCDGHIFIKAAIYNGPKSEEQINELHSYLEYLTGFDPAFFYEWTEEEMTEDQWNRFWKSLFQPQKISGGLVIKPVWHEYAPEDGEQVICIDPGTAFGTGTHATTLMCIDFLHKTIRPGMKVIDVGTGSGILALAACFLGASEVEALDFHQDAVTAAQENIQRNQKESVIDVRQSDLLDESNLRADIIVANISEVIIKKLLPQLKDHLQEEGFFICSGLTYDQREEMTQAILENKLEIIEVAESGNWISFLAKNIK